MFSSFPLPVLLLVFALAAVAVWHAGSRLSSTTDTLASHFHLGEALGGLLLLAIATNLPEIAITVTATLSGHIEIAAGNLLGGIGVQTVVLVALDRFGVHDKKPLTSHAESLVPLLEGLLVVAVLMLTVMGSRVSDQLIFAHLTPEDVAIAGVWIVGVWLIGKARKGLPWRLKEAAQEQASDDEKKEDAESKKIGKTVAVFAFAALVTLVAGFLLEQSGDAAATQLNISGALFGATILAAATALPELSTGLAAVKLGDYSLALSDIFGGNAFLPVLFLLATLVSGKAALPQSHSTDLYLAALGVLLTSIYMVGMVFRSQRKVLKMGIDSLLVLITYLVFVAGLVFVSSK